MSNDKEIEELGRRVHDLTEELILTDQRLEDEKEKYIKEKEEEEEMIECPYCKKEFPDLEAHFEESPECKEAFKKESEEKALTKFAKDSLDSRSKIDWEAKATKEQREGFIKREQLRKGIIPISQTETIDKLFMDNIAESFQLGKCPICSMSATEIRMREGTEDLLKKEKEELSDFIMGIGNWLEWLEKKTKEDITEVSRNKALGEDLLTISKHMSSKHPKTAKILEKIFQIGKSGSGITKADSDEHIRKESKLAEKLSAKENLSKEERETFFRALKLSWQRKRKGEK